MLVAICKATNLLRFIKVGDLSCGLYSCSLCDVEKSNSKNDAGFNGLVLADMVLRIRKGRCPAYQLYPLSTPLY